MLVVAAALGGQAPDRKFSHRAALEKAGTRCLDCHAATVASTTSADRALRFNHKLHLAVRPDWKGQQACTGCHRGIERVETVTKANFPQMAECLVCHSGIDPPFSCEKCHTAAAAALMPPSHTAKYLDGHSSMKLDKPSCTICHGTNFRCLGCH